MLIYLSAHDPGGKAAARTAQCFCIGAVEAEAGCSDSLERAAWEIARSFGLQPTRDVRSHAWSLVRIGYLWAEGRYPDLELRAEHYDSAHFAHGADALIALHRSRRVDAALRA